MGLKRRIVTSVNRNIDRGITRSGMEVDKGIKKFMVKGRKSAMSKRKGKIESVFEIGGKRRTLLG